MPREAPDASDLATHAGFMATVRRVMQNMSCRPQADAKHNGRNASRAMRFGFARAKDAAPTLAAIAQQLGIEAAADADALRQIERLAQKPCPLLARLPPVAAAHTALQGFEGEAGLGGPDIEPAGQLAMVRLEKRPVQIGSVGHRAPQGWLQLPSKRGFCLAAKA